MADWINLTKNEMKMDGIPSNESHLDWISYLQILNESLCFTFEDLCAFEKYNLTLKFHSPVTQNNRWEGQEVRELGYNCDHVLRGVAKYNCPAYFEMDFLYRNPAKIFKTRERDGENRVFVIIAMATDI